MAACTVNRLGELAGRLALRVEDLDEDVAANPRAAEAVVGRSVGRLAACIDELADSYRLLRKTWAAGDAAPLPELLAGVHRHLLVEIERWLDQLVRVIQDPAAARAERGLPATGPAEITVKLKMTDPPQIRELDQWVRKYGQPLEIGFWGKAGLLALGWGLANALFGSGDDGC
jgi:hypothetical protein